jgi:hypothetical protein
MLALADITGEAERLPKGEPARAGKLRSITAPHRISTLIPE